MGKLLFHDRKEISEKDSFKKAAVHIEDESVYRDRHYMDLNQLEKQFGKNKVVFDVDKKYDFRGMVLAKAVQEEQESYKRELNAAKLSKNKHHYDKTRNRRSRDVQDYSGKALTLIDSYRSMDPASDKAYETLKDINRIRYQIDLNTAQALAHNEDEETMLRDRARLAYLVRKMGLCYDHYNKNGGKLNPGSKRMKAYTKEISEIVSEYADLKHKAEEVGREERDGYKENPQSLLRKLGILDHNPVDQPEDPEANEKSGDESAQKQASKTKSVGTDTTDTNSVETQTDDVEEVHHRGFDQSKLAEENVQNSQFKSENKSGTGTKSFDKAKLQKNTISEEYKAQNKAKTFSNISSSHSEISYESEKKAKTFSNISSSHSEISYESEKKAKTFTNTSSSHSEMSYGSEKQENILKKSTAEINIEKTENQEIHGQKNEEPFDLVQFKEDVQILLTRVESVNQSFKDFLNKEKGIINGEVVHNNPVVRRYNELYNTYKDGEFEAKIRTREEKLKKLSKSQKSESQRQLLIQEIAQIKADQKEFPQARADYIRLTKDFMKEEKAAILKDTNALIKRFRDHNANENAVRQKAIALPALTKNKKRQVTKINVSIGTDKLQAMNACWAISLATLLRARGVDIDYHDIYNYNVKDEITEFENVENILKYNNERQNADVANYSEYEQFYGEDNFVNHILKKSGSDKRMDLHTRRFALNLPDQKYYPNMDAKTAMSDAIAKGLNCGSPVSLLIGAGQSGHYLTITGMNDGKVYYKHALGSVYIPGGKFADSKKKGIDDEYVVPLSDLLKFTNNKNVELTWMTLKTQNEIAKESELNKSENTEKNISQQKKEGESLQSENKSSESLQKNDSKPEAQEEAKENKSLVDEFVNIEKDSALFGPYNSIVPKPFKHSSYSEGRKILEARIKAVMKKTAMADEKLKALEKELNKCNYTIARFETLKEKEYLKFQKDQYDKSIKETEEKKTAIERDIEDAQNYRDNCESEEREAILGDANTLIETYKKELDKKDTFYQENIPMAECGTSFLLYKRNDPKHPEKKDTMYRNTTEFAVDEELSDRREWAASLAYMFRNHGIDMTEADIVDYRITDRMNSLEDVMHMLDFNSRMDSKKSFDISDGGKFIGEENFVNHILRKADAHTAFTMNSRKFEKNKKGTPDDFKNALEEAIKKGLNEGRVVSLTYSDGKQEHTITINSIQENEIMRTEMVEKEGYEYLKDEKGNLIVGEDGYHKKEKVKRMVESSVGTGAFKYEVGYKTVKKKGLDGKSYEKGESVSTTRHMSVDDFVRFLMDKEIKLNWLSDKKAINNIEEQKQEEVQNQDKSVLLEKVEEQLDKPPMSESETRDYLKRLKDKYKDQDISKINIPVEELYLLNVDEATAKQMILEDRKEEMDVKADKSLGKGLVDDNGNLIPQENEYTRIIDEMLMEAEKLENQLGRRRVFPPGVRPEYNVQAAGKKGFFFQTSATAQAYIDLHIKEADWMITKGFWKVCRKLIVEDVYTKNQTDKNGKPIKQRKGRENSVPTPFERVMLYLQQAKLIAQYHTAIKRQFEQDAKKNNGVSEGQRLMQKYTMYHVHVKDNGAASYDPKTYIENIVAAYQAVKNGEEGAPDLLSFFRDGLDGGCYDGRTSHLQDYCRDHNLVVERDFQNLYKEKTDRQQAEKDRQREEELKKQKEKEKEEARKKREASLTVRESHVPVGDPENPNYDIKYNEDVPKIANMSVGVDEFLRIISQKIDELYKVDKRFSYADYQRAIPLILDAYPNLYCKFRFDDIRIENNNPDFQSKSKNVYWELKDKETRVFYVKITEEFLKSRTCATIGYMNGYFDADSLWQQQNYGDGPNYDLSLPEDKLDISLLATKEEIQKIKPRQATQNQQENKGQVKKEAQGGNIQEVAVNQQAINKDKTENQGGNIQEVAVNQQVINKDKTENQAGKKVDNKTGKPVNYAELIKKCARQIKLVNAEIDDLKIKQSGQIRRLKKLTQKKLQRSDSQYKRVKEIGLETIEPSEIWDPVMAAYNNFVENSGAENIRALEEAVNNYVFATSPGADNMQVLKEAVNKDGGQGDGDPMAKRRSQAVGYMLEMIYNYKDYTQQLGEARKKLEKYKTGMENAKSQLNAQKQEGQGQEDNLEAQISELEKDGIKEAEDKKKAFLNSAENFIKESDNVVKNTEDYLKKNKK